MFHRVQSIWTVFAPATLLCLVLAGRHRFVSIRMLPREE
jgi:hypothetical protein